MKRNWEKFLLVGLTFASALLAISLYGVMPERMITHWGLYGQPDGWMNKSIGLAMLPILNLFMLVVHFLVPIFEPKKNNLASFRKEYDRLMLWIFLVLNYIVILSYLYNLGVIFNMGRMVIPALGVLYIAIGSILPKAKQNFMVGIRNPWTLSSERVWKKTHVIGGRLFIVSGIATVLSVFLPINWAFVVSIGSILLSTAVIMIYSWKEYHNEASK